MISSYIQKPIPVQATQFFDNTGCIEELCDFMRGQNVRIRYRDDGPVLMIDTLEGSMACREGDYILKGPAGEFYPCRKDIFEQTYDFLY